MLLSHGVCIVHEPALFSSNHRGRFRTCGQALEAWLKCMHTPNSSPAVSQDMHCITSYIDVSAVPGDNDKTADAVDRCGILSAYRRRRHMQLSTGYDGAALGLLELASEAERS